MSIVEVYIAVRLRSAVLYSFLCCPRFFFSFMFLCVWCTVCFALVACACRALCHAFCLTYFLKLPSLYARSRARCAQAAGRAGTAVRIRPATTARRTLGSRQRPRVGG